MSDVFSILVVCTGNICRSAQAEQLIRARVAKDFSGLEPLVVVQSAGTNALVGSGMPTEAAALSADHGGSPSDHVAQQLTAEQVRGADLVLTMTVEHRSAVVRLVPRASRYTFTLNEFAALVEDAAQHTPTPAAEFFCLHAVEKLRTAVTWTSARRGYLPLEETSAADIVDPYRRSQDIYEESARQITKALERSQRAAVNLGRKVGP